MPPPASRRGPGVLAGGSLHFVEFHGGNLIEDSRSSDGTFDVLLEGKQALEGYQPKLLEAETRATEIQVDDGFLDVEFLHRVQYPRMNWK